MLRGTLLNRLQCHTSNLSCFLILILLTLKNIVCMLYLYAFAPWQHIFYSWSHSSRVFYWVCKTYVTLFWNWISYFFFSSMGKTKGERQKGYRVGKKSKDSNNLKKESQWQKRNYKPSTEISKCELIERREAVTRWV